MSSDLVRIEEASDPTFVLDSERGLQLSALARERVAPPDAWRWLAMRVAREPLDLRAHTQRIRLLTECREPSRLFGALVDLFLVLGSKGIGLRYTLLDIAREVLDPDDHAYLRAHLVGGLHPGAHLPMAMGSVISRGVLGTSAMVSAVATARPPAPHDPYDDPFHVPPEREA